jgi:hypothetical protein
MIAGLTPGHIKTLSSLFVAIGIGQTVVNVARGQDIGGLGGVVRGFTGFNQKQLSETALQNGSLVYGEASEELGAHLQNAFKLGLVAACPLTAIPMALWEGAEIVDEVRRPDSYTTLGRAKDLFVDVPLSIATIVGIAGMAFAGGKGKALKHLGVLLTKDKTINKTMFAAFKELAKKGRKNLSPAELKKMKRMRNKIRNSKKAIEAIRHSELKSFGGFLDKYIMSNVNIIRSGMKSTATVAPKAAQTLATVA